MCMCMQVIVAQLRQLRPAVPRVLGGRAAQLPPRLAQPRAGARHGRRALRLAAGHEQRPLFKGEQGRGSGCASAKSGKVHLLTAAASALRVKAPSASGQQGRGPVAACAHCEWLQFLAQPPACNAVTQARAPPIMHGWPGTGKRHGNCHFTLQVHPENTGLGQHMRRSVRRLGLRAARRTSSVSDLLLPQGGHVCRTQQVCAQHMAPSRAHALHAMLSAWALLLRAC